MDGFIILGGRRAQHHDQSLAATLGSDWRLARSNTAGTLFARKSTPVRDAGGVWIVGDVFMRGAKKVAPPALDHFDEDQDFERYCAAFVRRYWGRYVLIAPRRRSVLRAPSGHLDCVIWESSAGWGAASEVAEGLLADELPSEFGIDWGAIARGAMQFGHELGLAGMRPVLPGALSTVGSGTPDRLIWDPRAFALQPHPSYEASKQSVAEAVEEALGAELSLDGPVLAEISGGLDSGIVATTLARLGAGERARFVNLHAQDPASDEREYARAIAAQAGLTLLELEKPELILDEGLLGAMPTGLRPSVNGLDHHYDAGMARQAHDFGAARILTGQGGDIVFYQSPSVVVGTEIWGRWLRAPRADPWWRQLEDMARWNRRSVWSLLGETVRAAKRGSPDELALHPWLSHAVAPAKRRQLTSLARSQLFHGLSLRGQSAKLVHPLLHQPIQEAVLSAPVVDLARHGVGRGLARDAFSSQLPDAVRRRRSKGDLTAYYGRMVLRSLPTLRSYLLDGRLSAERVLDRNAAEGLLDADRLIHEGDYPRLFEFVALEAFVRYWEGRCASLAALDGSSRRSLSQGRTSA